MNIRARCLIFWPPKRQFQIRSAQPELMRNSWPVLSLTIWPVGPSSAWEILARWPDPRCQLGWTWLWLDPAHCGWRSVRLCVCSCVCVCIYKFVYATSPGIGSRSTQCPVQMAPLVTVDNDLCRWLSFPSMGRFWKPRFDYKKKIINVLNKVRSSGLKDSPQYCQKSSVTSVLKKTLQANCSNSECLIYYRIVTQVRCLNVNRPLYTTSHS